MTNIISASLLKILITIQKLYKVSREKMCSLYYYLFIYYYSLLEALIHWRHLKKKKSQVKIINFELLFCFYYYFRKKSDSLKSKLVKNEKFMLQ